LRPKPFEVHGALALECTTLLIGIPLKQTLKRLLGRHAADARQIVARLGVRSWSQEGEDRVLARFFEGKGTGFYVDIGAHHPFRFSNTCLMHRRGWRGINIDATPGSMAAFRRHRPNDINLEIGIAETSDTAKFFMFDEPALNTFDEELARQYDRPPWRLNRTIDVPLRPLRDVMIEHCRAGQQIDLLTIDVEGRDVSVLRSHDWDAFRPHIVLVEALGVKTLALRDDPGFLFMRSQEFEPFAKTVNTVMYVDSRRL